MDGPVRIAAPSSTWTLETAYQYATQRAVPPSEPDGEPLYNCPFPPCSKQFSKRFNLKAHLRVHTGDKPFACNFPGCSRRFMWKSSLTSHHTGHNRRNAHIAKRNAAAAAAVLADVAARSAPLTSSISASHPWPPEQRALPAPPFCRAPSPYHPQHAAAAPPAHASSQPLPSYDAASYAQHAAASHAPPLRVHPPLSQPLPSIQAPRGTPMDSKRDPLHPHLAPIAPKHEPQRIFPMAPMAPKVEPQPQLQPPQPQAMHSHASAMHAHAPPALASAAQPVTPTTLTPARELLSRDTFMSKSPPPALLPCASTFMHGSSTLLPSTSTLLPSPSLLPRSPGAFGQHMSFAASPSWGAPLSHGVGRAVSPMTRGAGDVPMAAASSTSGELSPLAVSPGVSSSSTAVNAGRWRRGGAAGGRASKPPLGGPGLTAGANALLPPLAHVAPKNPPTHIDLGGLGDEEHSSSLPALGSPHTELSPLPVASPIFGTSQTPPSPIQQPFSPFSGGPVSSAKSRAPAAWYP